MKTIWIEYPVPDNDCIACEKSYVFDTLIGRVCTQFDNAMLAQKDGSYQRCDECLESEQK